MMNLKEQLDRARELYNESLEAIKEGIKAKSSDEYMRMISAMNRYFWNEIERLYAEINEEKTEAYEDFTITGSIAARFVVVGPTGFFSESYETIEEAKKAIDLQIAIDLNFEEEVIDEVQEAINEAPEDNFDDLKNCTDCSKCRRECPHKNTFRRLHAELGGLGLCENL